MEWQENASRLHTFINDLRPASPEISFSDWRGPDLTVSELEFFYSAQKRTNRYGFYSGLQAWCKRAES